MAGIVLTSGPGGASVLPTAEAYTDSQIAALNLGDASTHAAADFDAAGAAAARQPLVPPNADTATSGTLQANKHHYISASGGNVSRALPTGQAAGTQILLEKSDSSTNTVSATGSIRGVGSSTFTLSLSHQLITFVADSSGSWWPFPGHITLGSLDARFQPLSLEGTLAARPAASTVTAKTIYWATDVAGGTLYRSDGSAWAQMAAGTTTSGAVLAAVTSTANQTNITSTTAVDLNPSIITPTFVADGTQVQILASIPTVCNNTALDGWALYLVRNDGTTIDYVEGISATANARQVATIMTVDTPANGVTTSYKLQGSVITAGTMIMRNVSNIGQCKIVVRHG